MRDKMGIERASKTDIPDYRSIYLLRLGKKYGKGEESINAYGGFETDVELLPMLTNAAEGSTYHCDDTGSRYRLTKNGWLKVGSGSTGDPSDLDYGTFAVAALRKGVNNNEN